MIKSPGLFMLPAILGLLSVPSDVWSQEKTPPIPTINQRIVQYCRQVKGKQIGNGQCWELAFKATEFAQAERPGIETPLYAYGILLKKDEAVLPGDLIQFEQAKFTYPNGNFSVLPKHTAIVDKVNGSRLTMWHQNFNGRLTVHTYTIDHSKLSQGRMMIYRPQPRAR